MKKNKKVKKKNNNTNQLVSYLLVMFLVLYVAMAAHKVPKVVINIFNNTLFRLGYVLIMIYLYHILSAFLFFIFILYISVNFF